MIKKREQEARTNVKNVRFSAPTVYKLQSNKQKQSNKPKLTNKIKTKDNETNRQTPPYVTTFI